MFTILGTDDSVQTCDCCGRTNLKYTVTVQTEDGEILHYGSTCATRHTKYTSKEIKGFLKEIKDRETKEYRIRLMDAIGVFWETAEFKALCAKEEEARKQSLVGRSFADFCKQERIAHNAKEKELIEKFNLYKTSYLF